MDVGRALEPTEVLLGVVDDLPLLLADELLLLEVNLEDSLDADEDQPAQKTPVQVALDVAAENISDEGRNRRQKQGAAQDSGRGQRVGQRVARNLVLDGCLLLRGRVVWDGQDQTQ